MFSFGTVPPFLPLFAESPEFRIRMAQCFGDPIEPFSFEMKDIIARRERLSVVIGCTAQHPPFLGKSTCSVRPRRERGPEP